MKKIIALSAVLVMGALGMACGDSAANNTANANKMVANAMNAANSAMANAANQLANANAQMSNAMSTANSMVSNANKMADNKMADNKMADNKMANSNVKKP